jgi:hypothetical protein
MVFYIQNYWVFGLYPSSGILGTREHDVSETDPVYETSCSVVSRISDDGKKSKNPVIMNSQEGRSSVSR